MDKNAERLKALQQSKVFAPDFPKRPQMTYAQYCAMPYDKRPSEFWDLGNRGTEAERELEPSVAIVDLLGREQYEPAVEILAQLWRECGFPNLRYAAADALRRIGSEPARAAVIDLLDDWHRNSISFAIKTIFDAAPEKAYDRLIGRFEPEQVRKSGGATVPWEVLRFFAPMGYGSFFTGNGVAAKPEYADQRSPRWLARISVGSSCA